MDFSRNTLFHCFLLCAVLFSAQVVPRWWGDSIVMDEEWDLTASYYYWKQGEVSLHAATTAPGALCALPLVLMDLKFEPIDVPDWRTRSLKLLFMDNAGRLGAVTAASRSVALLLGLLVGYLLYRALRRGAPVLCAAALFLWSFEPTLLAFSGTAKTDLPAAFWFFLCVLYFNRVRGKGGIMPFLETGFLAGLAAASRYNGLLILPVILALDALGRPGLSGAMPALWRRIPQWLGLVTGFALCLFLAYLPGFFLSPDQPWPLSPYFSNLGFYAGQRPELFGQTVHFAGRSWEGGSILCFPYHFFFKNTLPFFLLLAAGVALALAKKIQIPPWVWVPPLVYLGCFWLADKSMNIRHALPAYPFLILIAAYAFQWLWQSHRKSSRPWTRFLAAGLLLCHAASVLYQFPRHIAYANEFMSTQDKPAKLYSFNWNLGQDMKRLAETAKARGWKRVKLLTGQRTDPYFYGMSWESWRERDLVEPQSGTVYVVEASITSDRRYYNDLFSRNHSWLLGARETGNLGGALAYYEIPGTWDETLKDDSPQINSAPYYAGGIPPYRRTTPPGSWIAP